MTENRNQQTAEAENLCQRSEFIKRVYDFARFMQAEHIDNGDKAMLICAIDGDVSEGRAGMAQIVLGEPYMVTAGLSSMMSEERMSHIFRAARAASVIEDSSIQDVIGKEREKFVL